MVVGGPVADVQVGVVHQALATLDDVGDAGGARDVLAAGARAGVEAVSLVAAGHGSVVTRAAAFLGCD